MSTRLTYSHIGRSDLDRPSRSLHFPAAFRTVLRLSRMCFGVVHVIRRSTNIPCPWIDSAIQFLLYTADLIQLIQRNYVHPHLYADDTQIWYMSSVSCGHFSIYVCVYGQRRFVDAQQSAFNSTTRRMRCCGVRRAVSNIRFHGKPHALTTILSRLPVGYVTWASTWIPSFHEDSCFQNCVELLIL